MACSGKHQISVSSISALHFPRHLKCQLQENDAEGGRLQTERSFPSAQRRAVEDESRAGARRQVQLDDILAEAATSATDTLHATSAAQHLQAPNCEAAKAKMCTGLPGANTCENISCLLVNIRLIDPF